MAKLEWVGKARTLKPDGLYEIVVNQPGVGATTYGQAQRVGRIAEMILAPHKAKSSSRKGKKQDPGVEIKVTRGNKGVDAFVYLDDSASDQAAAAIEFGHTNNRTGKRVEGIAPLRKAAGLA